MAGAVEALLNGFQTGIEKTVREQCIELCESLCLAAIYSREHNRRAHNFTGNLINSIVVALYENKKLIQADYAAQKLGKPAIHVKMSVPKNYKFKSDWDEADTMFSPEIRTDEGWGVNDARNFVKSYEPSVAKGFVITVAYPVEYAEFIEKERASTGYQELKEDVFQDAYRIGNWIVKDTKSIMDNSLWGNARGLDIKPPKDMGNHIVKTTTFKISLKPNDDSLPFPLMQDSDTAPF